MMFTDRQTDRGKFTSTQVPGSKEFAGDGMTSAVRSPCRQPIVSMIASIITEKSYDTRGPRISEGTN